MKILYIIPLAMMLSCCSSVKNQSVSGSGKLDTQLLKDVETLSSDAYQGRKTGTKGAELARAYIIERFQKLGLKSYPQHVNYAQEFTFNSRSGAKVNGTNIIGYIPGKGSNAIVVSAHYDHLGVVKDQVFNGADDNASGTAGLLKIAAYFAKNKPNNTIIFAAFDAEEMGLQGAKAFVGNPPVPINTIAVNLNMDMISHSEKGELYVCGTFKYPQLKRYVDTTRKDVKVILGHDDPKLGHDDWTNQSDQGAFNAKNIPFLYFGVEDHKDYHKATDEYPTITKQFFSDASNAVLDVVKSIDRQTGLQQLLKDKMIMKN
ncbi:M28 family peptidase [Pedobacter endophyticus]|uniref:M28 family peptidase n=1 Tax=Pedobacter endophyticus TaxID=2789740 RepID=A0A7S9KZL3_9SPHI|nr:M28 family peptidase [Pedobacter endophyticus]QPH39401.1 M28 family peptidase [Pedobacter endophyticus]